MLEAPTSQTVFDARTSPAKETPRELLHLDGPGQSRGNGTPVPADTYDRLSRWLMASDQRVAGHLSRALVEVHDGKLYKHEGHVLWSAYLKAFVPLTQRWCQQEMSRERKLRLFPKLAAAFEQGQLCKSRVRVILAAVTPHTEDVWLAWGTTFSVRKLEILAREETAPAEDSEKPGEETTGHPPGRRRARGRQRAVLVPPGVAVLVAAAVDLARKVEGYQISRGTAIEAMAMEAMSGVGRWPDGAKEEPGKASVSSDGIEGEGWREEAMGQWQHLSWEFPEVMLEGAPADDAPAHQRVVFWSQAQGRLDAVRGRLLRIMRECRLAKELRFASLDQYVRERAGLSAREADDLIRLDVELSDLPVAFRMYAAGRLGRSAAWLVARAVRLKGDNRAERAWVRFALCHSFRKLEAAVEAAELHRQADWADFQAHGGWPPEDKSFAEVLQMCSHFTVTPEAGQSMTRLTFVLDEDQQATYEQALRVLRGLYGQDRPEWWCLAVMARHFLEMYGHADDHVKKTLARRVIQRDEYTCGAPECLRRGGLEADHIELRSRRGPSVEWNEGSLCGGHHRHIKHELGALTLYGKAPDDLWVKMGERLYHKDRLVQPELYESVLDEDPWAIRVMSEARVEYLVS